MIYFGMKFLCQFLVFKFDFVIVIRTVHSVCLWDDKGATKLHNKLKEDILDFIHYAQSVCCVINSWSYND